MKGSKMKKIVSDAVLFALFVGCVYYLVRAYIQLKHGG